MRRIWVIAAAALLCLHCDRRPETTKAKAPPAATDTKKEAPAAASAVSTPTKVERPQLKAGELVYIEQILGDAKPDDPLPMIVAIHGLGDTPENFAHVFDAFSEGARLILPQGVDPTDGGGWSWFDIRARDPDVEALAKGIKSSADKIAVAIGELKSKRPTKGQPIVTGFSQGGMLTFTLAVHHPDAVGVAVPVGGWLPPPLWPQDKPSEGKALPPTLALHGTADRAVIYEPTKEAVDHLAGLGFPVELKTYEGVPHAIVPEMRRDLYDRVSDAVRAANKQSAPAEASP